MCGLKLALNNIFDDSSAEGLESEAVRGLNLWWDRQEL